MKIRWTTGLKSLRKHMIDFNIDVMIINDPNNIYRITSHKVIAPNINQIYLIVPKDGNPALICHNFIKPTFLQCHPYVDVFDSFEDESIIPGLVKKALEEKGYPRHSR